MEKAIHVSNVAALDPETKKPTRIGFKIEGNKKIRIAKKSGKKLA
jgi:large subunit ribosomal protein L24